MEVPAKRRLVAVNAVRARLTILGFNLAICTFQIVNVRTLGGGIPLEGFEAPVHAAAGTVLLIGVALSVASMVVFVASSSFDREGTCDHRLLLAGDLLMYLALAQTVTGKFSPYAYAIDITIESTESVHPALSALRAGLLVAGGAAWLLATYVGPVFSLLRAPHRQAAKLLHVAGHVVILASISRLWWAALMIEGRVAEGSGGLSAWLNAFVAPLFW
jgi:hypothetical protein